MCRACSPPRPLRHRRERCASRPAPCSPSCSGSQNINTAGRVMSFAVSALTPGNSTIRRSLPDRCTCASDTPNGLIRFSMMLLGAVQSHRLIVVHQDPASPPAARCATRPAGPGPASSPCSSPASLVVRVVGLAGQIDAEDRARHALPEGRFAIAVRQVSIRLIRPHGVNRTARDREDEQHEQPVPPLRISSFSSCSSVARVQRLARRHPLRDRRRQRVHRRRCRSRSRSAPGPSSGMYTSRTVPRKPDVVSTSSPILRSLMSFCCLFCSCCCGRRMIR